MRQLLFTGFNAFGQHTASGRVDALTAINVPVADPDNVIISLSWRYTAYAQGSRIWLQGLLDAAPGECLEVEAPLPIKAVAACESHCLVLLEHGELYKLPAKLDAQLQQLRLEAPPAAATVPSKRSLSGTIKSPTPSASSISHIACGDHINVAISAGNAVYSIPSCLHQFPRQWRLQQLECGQEHALLLNGNGDVYSWGNGLRGQLGQATLGVEETPLLVEALAGIKITQIAAGGWHSGAISSFGDLYVWGLNSHGQLGMRVMKPDGLHKQPTVYPLPQLLDLPACCGNDDDHCAPVQVFAGWRHTLLLRRCGRLWATGWSEHGQLGQRQLNKAKFLDSFQEMSKEGRILKIKCGPWATLIELDK